MEGANMGSPRERPTAATSDVASHTGSMIPSTQDVTLQETLAIQASAGRVTSSSTVSSGPFRRFSRRLRNLSSGIAGGNVTPTQVATSEEGFVVQEFERVSNPAIISSGPFRRFSRRLRNASSGISEGDDAPTQVVTPRDRLADPESAGKVSKPAVVISGAFRRFSRRVRNVSRTVEGKVTPIHISSPREDLASQESERATSPTISSSGIPRRFSQHVRNFSSRAAGGDMTPTRTRSMRHSTPERMYPEMLALEHHGLPHTSSRSHAGNLADVEYIDQESQNPSDPDPVTPTSGLVRRFSSYMHNFSYPDRGRGIITPQRRRLMRSYDSRVLLTTAEEGQGRFSFEVARGEESVGMRLSPALVPEPNPQRQNVVPSRVSAQMSGALPSNNQDQLFNQQTRTSHDSIYSASPQPPNSAPFQTNTPQEQQQPFLHIQALKQLPDSARPQISIPREQQQQFSQTQRLRQLLNPACSQTSTPQEQQRQSLQSQTVKAHSDIPKSQQPAFRSSLVPQDLNDHPAFRRSHNLKAPQDSTKMPRNAAQDQSATAGSTAQTSQAPGHSQDRRQAWLERVQSAYQVGESSGAPQQSSDQSFTAQAGQNREVSQQLPVADEGRGPLKSILKIPYSASASGSTQRHATFAASEEPVKSTYTPRAVVAADGELLNADGGVVEALRAAAKRGLFRRDFVFDEHTAPDTITGRVRRDQHQNDVEKHLEALLANDLMNDAATAVEIMKALKPVPTPRFNLTPRIEGFFTPLLGKTPAHGDGATKTRPSPKKTTRSRKSGKSQSSLRRQDSRRHRSGHSKSRRSRRAATLPPCPPRKFTPIVEKPEHVAERQTLMGFDRLEFFRVVGRIRRLESDEDLGRRDLLYVDTYAPEDALDWKRNEALREFTLRVASGPAIETDVMGVMAEGTVHVDQNELAEDGLAGTREEDERQPASAKLYERGLAQADHRIAEHAAERAGEAAAEDRRSSKGKGREVIREEADENDAHGESSEVAAVAADSVAEDRRTAELTAQAAELRVTVGSMESQQSSRQPTISGESKRSRAGPVSLQGAGEPAVSPTGGQVAEGTSRESGRARFGGLFGRRGETAEVKERKPKKPLPNFSNVFFGAQKGF